MTKQWRNNWLTRGLGVTVSKFWQQVINVLFGYDFFISYAWDDGRNYAIKLVDALEKHQFECFLDSRDYAKGYDWKVVGELALRRTHFLILVASAEALKSPAVLHELTIFSRRGHIIPIAFGESLSLDSAPKQVHDLLAGSILFIKETENSLSDGPRIETVEDLTNSFDVLTQRQKRIRIFSIATLVFALVATAAVWFWSEAIDQLHSTQVEQARFRASNSNELLDRGLASQALMLAVSAIPGPHDPNRVFEPSALGAAMKASISLRTQNVSRHDKEIIHQAISSDEELLFSVDSGGGMYLWDTKTGLSLWKLTEKKGYPNWISFSHSGVLVAVAFDGGGIEVRRTVDGALFDSVPANLGESEHFIFSPDDSWIASAHSNGYVVVSSLSSGQNILKLEIQGEAGYRIAISPDGSLISAGTESGRIHIWRTKDWVELVIIDDLVNNKSETSSYNGIILLDFSEDSKSLLAASFGDKALLWDRESRRKYLFYGTDDIVDGFHFSPHDTKYLLHIRKENSPTEIQIKDVENPTWVRLLRYSGKLESAAWVSDGTRIVTFSDDLKLGIWNSQNGDIIDSVSWEIPANSLSVSKGLVVSRNSSLAYVIYDKNVYQVYTGPLAEKFDIAKYPGNRTPVDNLLVSPGGTKIAFSDVDGQISVWDRTNNSTQAVPMQDCRSRFEFGFSSGGTQIVSGSEYGSIFICNSKNGETVRKSKRIYSNVKQVKFLPDDRRVIAQTLPLVTGRPNEHHAQVSVYDMQTDTDVRLQYCPSRGSKITAGRFILNGDRIITWCFPRSDIQVYEASSLKLLGQIPVSRSSISVSQNANRLAYDTSTDEKRGAVWDLSNVSPLLALPPENEAIGYAHNSTMSSNGKYVMAFNPIDQRRIKVGKVKIWEVETGEVKAILENVDFSCESGAFIAFDEWIAFNCNKSLDIYDVSTGGFLVSIPISHENISKSVLTPDRHGLVIASDKGEIRYLNLWKTRKDLIDWATKQLRKIKPMDEKTCERRFINSMVCDALQGTDKLTSDKG